MSAVPEKNGAPLLELRTPVGAVYATPSLWQRLYLQWMFRNFRTLPRQVLNRRQQHLIDNLCRAGSVSRKRPLGTTVIGAVENVTIPDSRAETAATASQPAPTKLPTETSISFPPIRSEGTAVRWNGAITRRIDLGRLLPRRPAQNGVPRESAMPGSKPADLNPHRHGHLVRWAAVGVSAALLLGTFVYLREARAGRSMSIAKVEAHQSVSRAMTAPPAVQSAAEPSSTAARNQVTTNAVQPPSPPRPRRHEGSGPVERAGLRQPLPATGSAPERLQVAEPPENGFTYPIAPDPNMSGRVDLKAVIGSDGKVKAVDVVSGNRELAAAAVRAVQHWRYRPPELNGHFVEAETNIVISFAGDEAVSVRFPTTP